MPRPAVASIIPLGSTTQGLRPPLTHGTCYACQTDPAAALAFCGELAWPPGGAHHVCDYPTFACGCQPCNVCLALTGAPCERCGSRGIPHTRPVEA